MLCVGLHHSEGEGCCVSAPHSWEVRCQEVQKSTGTVKPLATIVMLCVCVCVCVGVLTVVFCVQCPIVERLTNSLMMHGRNNGKKLMAVTIVKHSFEIIHLLTGEVGVVCWVVVVSEA